MLSVTQNESDKLFVGPNLLRIYSFAVGAQIIKSGFKPDFMVALWRGGAVPGCYIHELLKYKGIKSDHIAVRTSRYTGIDTIRESGDVLVHNLGYLSERLTHESKLLIVDDILDSGASITAFMATLKARLSDNFPKEIRIATIFYKPERNISSYKPDYFARTLAKSCWVVFPHELEGLSVEEIKHAMGDEVASIISSI